MTSKRPTVGYTPSDLREVADRVEKILAALSPIEEMLHSGLRVEVEDPNCEDFAVGFIGWEDGWLGFFPYKVDRPES